MDTAAEDVMTEIARLRDHIDTDHLVMVQLGLARRRSRQDA